MKNPNTPDADTYPALVVLDGDDELAAALPFGRLTALLAEQLVADFGDTVAVLVLTPEGSSPPARPPGSRVEWSSLAVPADVDRALPAVRARLTELAPHHAYTFLDASALGRELHRQLVRALGDARIVPGRRLVYLTQLPEKVLDFPGWSALPTHVILAARPPLERGLTAWSRKARAAGTALVNEGRRLRGTDESPDELPKPVEEVTPFCRLKLDPGAAEPATSESLSRWGRAVTGRRVGMALGGSGAWGYAHVALMQGLRARQIPIDVIASASSGSLMGSFYAANGDAGLARTIDDGRLFTLMAMGCVVSSLALEALVDLSLGPRPLESLEVVFCPVATDLSTNKAVMFPRAGLGFGVRASGCAPGVFGPTIANGALFVDGAVADNVPTNLVCKLGAAMIVVSNPLPAGPGVLVPAPRKLALFENFSPFFRMLEFMASFDLLITKVGEFEGRDHGSDDLKQTLIFIAPEPQPSPLARTFNFYDAKAIMAWVQASSWFLAGIAECEVTWAALRLPRCGAPRDP